MMVSGAILLVFGLLFMLCLYCYRESLKAAIAIIDATADFLIDTKRLILVSIAYFFISMIVFFMFIFAVGSVFSMVEFATP